MHIISAYYSQLRFLDTRRGHLGLQRQKQEMTK